MLAKKLAWTLLLAVALAGCARGSAEPQPPKIAYGHDLCASCGMIIDEARFAAATLDTGGEMRVFDDVGEMLTFHMDHPEAQVKAWFVHDYRTEAWLRGEGAFFVRSPRVASPMGSGIAAFERRSDADAFAAEVGASPLTLDELRVEVHVAAHP